MAPKTKMEDDDNVVAGHDASTEITPKCPIYHPSYKVVKAKLAEMIELLQGPLEQSTYTDPNVEGLKLLLKKRSKARFPDEVRIALVGDMASGKSSLINSLLSVGILARKGDIGTSCTWVIQEFRLTLPKQNKPFRAEIQYHSGTELEAVITLLFKEAYAALAPTKDSESEVQELDENYEQRNISGLTSIKTIMALFCDKPECATQEAVTDFVREASGETDQNITAKMLVWAKQLLVVYATAEDGQMSIVEAATPQDLLIGLRKYTFNAMDEDEDQESEITPWPLIKKITFGLDSPLLNNGVILVDLPGIHDSNGTRRRTVLKALSECTHYLVVAQISRAIDDETVTKSFGDGYTRKGSGRVITAITNTDRMDEASSRTGTAAEKERIDEANDKIEAIRAEMKQCAVKRKTATKLERAEIYDKEEELDQQLRDLTASGDSYKIMIRNKRVIKVLRRSYFYLTGDQRPLPIFCVSNRVYEQHQIGYERDDRPLLSLEDTQIPALRCHLRMATAEGRFNDALFHYEKQLPSLLTSFELWCCKTHMKRKRELEEMVLEPKEICQTIVQTLFDKIRAYIDSQILILIKQREKAWNVAATELCSKWKGENNIGPYLSLLRHDGYRRATKARPEISWNHDLVKILSPALTPCCNRLLDLITEVEQPIAVDLEAPLTKLKQKISTDPQSTLMALTPFLKKIEQEKPVMRQAVETNFRILKRRLKVVSLDLTTHTENSILGTCMHDTYESARSITGAGSGVRRPAKILDGVAGQGTLWMSVHKLARERFEEVLTTRQKVFERVVMGILVHIHESFKSCCQDKDVEEESEKALRLELKANMEKAKEIYDGVLSKAMAECKESLT